MSVRHVFFDLDGTLADTDRDIREAWKAAIADEGLACPDFDALFIAGPPFDEMAAILFPGRCTPALVARLKDGFARHYDHDGFPQTREYPGVMDEVRRLKAAGARVYIVTNKRYEGACAMARHFGWDRVFDGIYAGDMYAASLGKLRKPALLARLMAELGAEPATSALVGDTALDFEAAKSNGIRSVGVSWGYGKPEDLAQADVVCGVLPFPL